MEKYWTFKEYEKIDLFEAKADKDMAKLLKFIEDIQSKNDVPGNFSSWGYNIDYDHKKIEITAVSFKNEWRRKDDGKFLDYIFVAFPETDDEDYFKANQLKDCAEFVIKHIKNLK